MIPVGTPYKRRHLENMMDLEMVLSEMYADIDNEELSEAKSSVLTHTYRNKKEPKLTITVAVMSVLTLLAAIYALLS